MTITEPLVMGILNVTPDSFYAGSRSDTTQAIEARVGQMLAEDVDIIDIGAYSTRPGAAVVTADEEKARLAQAMEVIHRLAPNVVLRSTHSVPMWQDMLSSSRASESSTMCRVAHSTRRCLPQWPTCKYPTS